MNADIGQLNKKKAGLINLIHSKIKRITIKNILFKKAKTDVTMWVTLGDTCKELKRPLINKIL